MIHSRNSKRFPLSAIFCCWRCSPLWSGPFAPTPFPISGYLSGSFAAYRLPFLFFSAEAYCWISSTCVACLLPTCAGDKTAVPKKAQKRRICSHGRKVLCKKSKPQTGTLLPGRFCFLTIRETHNVHPPFAKPCLPAVIRFLTLSPSSHRTTEKTDLLSAVFLL